jgi:hypothetical protein
MSMEGQKTKPDYKKMLSNLFNAIGTVAVIYFIHSIYKNTDANSAAEHPNQRNNVTIIEDQPQSPSE